MMNSVIVLSSLLALCVVYTEGMSIYSRIRLKENVPVSSGTTVRVPFDVEAIDLGSVYNPQTFQMTVPDRGLYYIEVHVKLDNGKDSSAAIVKDSNGDVSTLETLEPDSYGVCKVGTTKRLDAGDKVYVTVTASSDLTISSQGTYIYFARSRY